MPTSRGADTASRGATTGFTGLRVIRCGGRTSGRDGGRATGFAETAPPESDLLSFPKLPPVLPASATKKDNDADHAGLNYTAKQASVKYKTACTFRKFIQIPLLIPVPGNVGYNWCDSNENLTTLNADKSDKSCGSTAIDLNGN